MNNIVILKQHHCKSLPDWESKLQQSLLYNRDCLLQVRYAAYASKIDRVPESLKIKIPGLGVFLLKSSTLDVYCLKANEHAF